MERAFAYAQTYPLEQEGNYPYEARDDNCRFNSGASVAKVTGYWDVQPGSVDQLKGALGYGPVSVAIEADQSIF